MVQGILADALELDAEERPAFLERTCGEDRALRSEVESLIHASESAGHYFADLADRAGMTGQEGPPPPPDIDLEGRRIGAYRLGKLLGRGGMGAVYQAERADGQFELIAALKILPLGAATPEAHRRFLEERRILARLEHPGIARLYDGGVTDDGTPFFVMERVEGVPLTEFCAVRHLGVEDRLRIFVEVCDAVAFAHNKLVVHRDLKPNNVLVTEAGQVKLLDFGVARLLEPGNEGATATQLGGRLMTPKYASPEQLTGEQVTTASDVYTLGVMLHELLTGISPYDLEAGSVTLMDAICRQPVTLPSTRLSRSAQATVGSTIEARDVVAAADAMGSSVRGLARTIRGDLDNILLMALRKEPERRYSSVDAFADDIRRHLDGFPVKARREGVTYVAGRFLRRNALPVGAAASIVLLIAVLGVVSTVFALRTSEQSREVRRERDRAEEIAHFMRELFEVANPTAVGETVTARELLDHGIHKIRTDHADEPALQAEMMTVLGTVYHHLGLRDDALVLLQEAEFVQRGLAEVHPSERASTLLELGRVLMDVDQAPGALPLMREARDLLSTEHEIGRAEVVKATLAVAGALRAVGDDAAARAEVRQALATFRTMAEAPGEAYLETLLALADGLLAVGDIADADPLYRQALTRVQENHGRAHPDIPHILMGLADIARATDRPQEATTLLRQAVALSLELASEESGEESPDVGRAYLALGRQLASMGETPEAREALDRAARILGAAADPGAQEALELLGRTGALNPEG